MALSQSPEENNHDACICGDSGRRGTVLYVISLPSTVQENAVDIYHRTAHWQRSTDIERKNETYSAKTLRIDPFFDTSKF